jgi:death-on-curing protein
MLLGVAANHPFEQGNKRTAFMAAVLFLNANGYQLRLPDDRTISQTIVDVITGNRPETDLIDLLSRYVVPDGA